MKKTLIALMALAGVACGDTYWNFEGGSYTSAGDAAYTGSATGTVTSVTTTVTTGSVLGNSATTALGGSLSFTDGSYLNVSNASALTAKLGTGSSKTGDFTIMAYVNFSEIVTNDGEKGYFFFGTGDSNGGGIALGVLANQTDYCPGSSKIDFLVKGQAHCVWDTTVAANEWNHLAFSYSSSSNEITLFVNGVSVGTTSAGNSYGAPNNNTIHIGAGSTNSGQDDFKGQVADLRIITGQALDADAVKWHAATLLPEPTTATLSLLALCGLAARRRRK